MEEITLAIVKPDGVSRNLAGEVIRRIENSGLRIVGAKMLKMSKEQAQGFYRVHKKKSFFESLTDFMSSGPCVVMALKGEDAIRRWRDLMGATNYEEAEKGTIRNEYASSIEKNVVHGSDSKENAQFEITYFFSELELVGQ